MSEPQTKVFMLPGVLCVWCGKIMTGDDCLDQMKAHDGECPEHPLSKQITTLTRRVAELEQEREQWEVNWNNAADFDLCRDLADGKSIAPAPGSVPDKLMRRVAELENALALVDSVNPKMGKRYESAWEIARSLLKPHPLTDCPKCGQFRGHGHEEHCPAALAANTQPEPPHPTGNVATANP